MRFGRMWSRIALIAVLTVACGRRSTGAEALTIPHPDNPSKTVEAFFERPAGKGPWPAVVLLHGYQPSPSNGGKDFVNWGVLHKFADRGYLAVAISQPGFGNSSGPADFCGPFTQHAVSGVIARLKKDHYIVSDKIVIEGISRGAVTAGLIAVGDPSLAGVVLISGLYDLPQFAANANSIQAKEVVSAMIAETGGATEALRARSLLNSPQNVKGPVLVLNGAKDDRTDPVQARRLAEEINSHGGRARAIIYADYGHQIPVQVRDKEIDRFIDGILGK